MLFWLLMLYISFFLYSFTGYCLTYLSYFILVNYFLSFTANSCSWHLFQPVSDCFHLGMVCGVVSNFSCFSFGNVAEVPQWRKTDDMRLVVCKSYQASAGFVQAHSLLSARPPTCFTAPQSALGFFSLLSPLDSTLLSGEYGIWCFRLRCLCVCVR